jgi:hypothetical protein
MLFRQSLGCISSFKLQNFSGFGEFTTFVIKANRMFLQASIFGLPQVVNHVALNADVNKLKHRMI